MARAASRGAALFVVEGTMRETLGCMAELIAFFLVLGIIIAGRIAGGF